MKIQALGHSCFLLEMATRDGDSTVRILVDPWLSDHVIGDLGGRFPRLRFDLEKLAPLDAVFITHSHTDHLDPYFLVRMWRELEPHPELLLPESLAYLEGAFTEHLPGVNITFLADQVPIDFRGLELTGFFSPELRATNEDDVQLLLARNGRETLVSEADALFPFQNPDARATLTEMLTEGEPETVAFLTTKNEGDATMAMLDASSIPDRERRVGDALDACYAEIHSIFLPPEELDEEEDPWVLDNVVRLVGGQGICWPQQLGSDWNRVLFPISLEDRVEMEREVADGYDCPTRIEQLIPGVAHEIGPGQSVSSAAIDWIELLDDEAEREFAPELQCFEDFPDAPIHDDERDVERQRERIESYVGNRFLPWLIGARNPPVEHLLGYGKGEYRVRVRFGTSGRHDDVDYVLRHSHLVFTAEDVEDVGSGVDEEYWANDLEDVLDGTCDEFSTICRRPPGGTQQRLWTCLGLPYLNNDLIAKKIRLHFERAARGETAEDWVLSHHGPSGS